MALTLFPFFTYVPTSGLLGETLPKVGWVGCGGGGLSKVVRATLPSTYLADAQCQTTECCQLSKAPKGGSPHRVPPNQPPHSPLGPRCLPFLDLLPPLQALFFVRIFADVLGRFLPRLSLLAAESPLTPLAAAGAKLAGGLAASGGRLLPTRCRPSQHL